MEINQTLTVKVDSTHYKIVKASDIKPGKRKRFKNCYEKKRVHKFYFSKKEFETINAYLSAKDKETKNLGLTMFFESRTYKHYKQSFHRQNRGIPIKSFFSYPGNILDWMKIYTIQ